jgi:hypothetical protein
MVDHHCFEEAEQPLQRRLKKVIAGVVFAYSREAFTIAFSAP